MLLFLILLPLFNCTNSNSSYVPLTLLLRNISVERLKPVTSYGFTKTRYLTYLESEINYIPFTYGTPPFIYSIEPNLPRGLSLDSNTGAIKGIIENTELVAEKVFTIKVKNSWGESTTNLKISILNPDSFTDKRNSNCYNNTTVDTCGDISFPNQDFEFKGKALSNEFIPYETLDGYSSDYFTFDKVRGQYWTCPNLKTGRDCSLVGVSIVDKESAVKYCSDLNTENLGKGYAGRKDWRLPEIQELFTITNYESPLIDSTFFPETNENCSDYWSNTNFDLTQSWRINNAPSIPTKDLNTAQKCFRCIAGRSNTKPSLIDNQDFTITDVRTRLVWQKCYSGLNLDSNCSGTTTSYNWTNALQYCKNLNLANRSWRLPSFNELMTLADFKKNSLPYHDLLFGNFSLPRNINTSTTDTSAMNQRFSINFTTGTGLSMIRQDKNFFTGPVRCVTDL